MAGTTKKTIRETFITLLEQRPLSEITVKELVTACEINRNTFYYHYRDIPELIEEIIREESENIIQKYPSVHSYLECFDALAEFASHRKRAIMHIYSSLSREVFERHLMEASAYFVRSYLETALREEGVTEQNREALVNYYKCLCFGVILDWLNHDMDEAYADSIRRILQVRQSLIIKMAETLR